MKKIGFRDESSAEAACAAQPEQPGGEEDLQAREVPAQERPGEKEKEQPRRSVVQVKFPEEETVLSYYNDRYDLHRGDRVFVEGKFAGVPGRVVGVSRSFKVRTADFKRVIGRQDTRVSGCFYPAGSHFVTFDKAALPKEKARSWYLPPVIDPEEFLVGTDDEPFPLRRMEDSIGVTQTIGEKGEAYYRENRVEYVCIDGTAGYAVVQGTQPYEVDFRYEGGEISSLVCSCPCGFNCKHEVAALLQLRKTLDIIDDKLEKQYGSSGYFAAVLRAALFDHGIREHSDGPLCLYAAD